MCREIVFHGNGRRLGSRLAGRLIHDWQQCSEHNQPSFRQGNNGLDQGHDDNLKSVVFDALALTEIQRCLQNNNLGKPTYWNALAALPGLASLN
jgi:hypothetical protein